MTPSTDDTADERDARQSSSRLVRDDRGVSFTVSYALTVAIATLLVAGVVASAGFVLQEQREEVVREELRVIGNDVSSVVMATDRLAMAGNSSNATVRRSLPARAINQPYTMRLAATSDGAVLTLRTDSPAVTVRVPLRNRTAIANESVTGGPVRVVYRSSTGKLTIEEGDR